MFFLTRSNLLKQLPDLNEIIRRLLEIVTVSHSIRPKADKSEHIFGNCYSEQKSIFYETINSDKLTPEVSGSCAVQSDKGTTVSLA